MDNVKPFPRIYKCPLRAKERGLLNLIQDNRPADENRKVWAQYVTARKDRMRAQLYTPRKPA